MHFQQQHVCLGIVGDENVYKWYSRDSGFA